MYMYVCVCVYALVFIFIKMYPCRDSIVPPAFGVRATPFEIRGRGGRESWWNCTISLVCGKFDFRAFGRNGGEERGGGVGVSTDKFASRYVSRILTVDFEIERGTVSRWGGGREGGRERGRKGALNTQFIR